MTLYIQAQFPFFILEIIIYHLEIVFITYAHTLGVLNRVSLQIIDDSLFSQQQSTFTIAIPYFQYERVHVIPAWWHTPLSAYWKHC